MGWLCLVAPIWRQEVYHLPRFQLHLHRWGVDRFAKSRALKVLAYAGVVNIEGRGKRSPKVTIVVLAEQSALRGITDMTRT